MTFTAAVIPTKNRPDLIRQCVRALQGQVDVAVIVDNNDEPDEGLLDLGVVVLYPGYPPNISRLLNVGIEIAEQCAAGLDRWNLAMLNDDAEVGPNWVHSLNEAMEGTGATLAYTDRLSRAERILYTGPPTTPWEAMTGWACLMRGELGLRWDESMAWWWSDSDLDYRCRALGGVVSVPGPIPKHHHPDEQTVSNPDLLAQAARDRETFERKWGRPCPW